MSKQISAFGVTSDSSPVGALTIERRATGPKDVSIDIEYCGICHSDIHQAHNDWKNTRHYPLVPGHEIIGRVTEIGPEVDAFKIGQRVSVGCMVNSCRTCGSCSDGDEQYCEKRPVMTYGGFDYFQDNAPTQGGYADNIVVDEHFVIPVPESLDPAGAAPLLCAGITTWSPLKHWNIGPGMKVGVIGLGGLGHMGVKFASAMGAHVVMITTSPEKADDAERLGANEVLISKDKDAMKAARGSFDFLLDTVPVEHPLNPYTGLLKKDGTLCLVGALEPLTFHAGLVVGGRRKISGSAIGSIQETREMLEFCAKHNITSDVEVIRPDQINEAWDRVQKSDVKYRFVIDLKAQA